MKIGARDVQVIGGGSLRSFSQGAKRNIKMEAFRLRWSTDV